jgi:hypothetical protein
MPAFVFPMLMTTYSMPTRGIIRAAASGRAFPASRLSKELYSYFIVI